MIWCTSLTCQPKQWATTSIFQRYVVLWMSQLLCPSYWIWLQVNVQLLLLFALTNNGINDNNDTTPNERNHVKIFMPFKLIQDAIFFFYSYMITLICKNAELVNHLNCTGYQWDTIRDGNQTSQIGVLISEKHAGWYDENPECFCLNLWAY